MEAIWHTRRKSNHSDWSRVHRGGIPDSEAATCSRQHFVVDGCRVSCRVVSNVFVVNIGDQPAIILALAQGGVIMPGTASSGKVRRCITAARSGVTYVVASFVGSSQPNMSANSARRHERYAGLLRILTTCTPHTTQHHSWWHRTGLSPMQAVSEKPAVLASAGPLSHRGTNSVSPL